MSDLTTKQRCEHVDYVLRTAACLGALGYSPHEAVCIVAEQLNTERSFVAEVLMRRASRVTPAAA